MTMKLSNIFNTIIGFVLLYVVMTHSIRYQQRDEFSLLMKAKVDTFHVLNFLQIDQLKGNYTSLISSLCAVLICLLLSVFKNSFILTLLLVATTIIFHISVLTLQTSEFALPISGVLQIIINSSKQPLLVISKQILSFFTLLSSTFPIIQPYMISWISAIDNYEFPAILLIVLGYSLINKKLQLLSCIYVPIIITLIIGIPLTIVYALQNSFLTSIQLLIGTVIFLVFFFNGLLQIELIPLAPVYYISIVLVAQSCVSFVTSYYSLTSLQADCLFVALYIVLFCLVLFKKFGTSLIPTLLMFFAISKLLGFTLSIEYLVPIFFLVHAFCSC
ncbi:hypothetical protein EDI_284900 [Entamoeba dispar SAW760]|uniref:Uncharacterized protein n=1 Tax=Entamoeba dispar (strain ATCC PRA-260 / SAW760) TaxID=370354 RepID=B0EV65_ENTDS|nr:uncharacterized protein EDI_284900 [Entamoeba dispar SAW760]EDR21572.1 hypothetical protein EDI_284900 [Entamoeba dispar SAW760]|eukprot:EDR21572.1 hypothetical protein EDI_284900 [Entamoeba dispar SAW760]